MKQKMLGVFFCAIKVNLPLDYYWIYKHLQITVTELNWKKSAVGQRYHAWHYICFVSYLNVMNNLCKNNIYKNLFWAFQVEVTEKKKHI